jgi:UDP-glucose 4-epimerase
LASLDDLAGCRVLVTGADGFIGSHLAEQLLSLGANVRALCVYNSRGSFGWLDGFTPPSSGKLECVLGDIRDERLMEALCDGIEIVFHLAALIAIPYSYQAPASFLDTNVRGTLNMLEAVRRANCRRLVNLSTSEVYGTPETVPIQESHPLRAQSPYSASKIAADKLCEAFACSFDTPVVLLRPFNTYGPRQSARAVMVAILTQLLHGTKELKLGNLTPRRDLTYVSDTVEGILRAGVFDLEPGEAIQLGTGTSYSIQELAELCAKTLGVEATITADPARMRPLHSEVDELLSDPSKARELLGWEPQVPLREGLEKTVLWLRENLQHYHSSGWSL